jgi:Zn-finger protein
MNAPIEIYTLPCRCGHTEDGSPHPCHADGYRCRKPAKQRFYGLKLSALSGFQMKVTSHDTWACDECWARFNNPSASSPLPSTPQTE